MKSSIIEIRNEDGKVIGHAEVEFEITASMSIKALPTLYPTIENARRVTSKLNTALATRRNGTSTSEGFDELMDALYATVEEIHIKRSSAEAAKANPYDDIVDIAEKIAAGVSYMTIDEFGSPAEKSVASAKRMMGNALTVLSALAKAVPPAVVDDILITALAEVGIPAAVEETATSIALL